MNLGNVEIEKDEENDEMMLNHGMNSIRIDAISMLYRHKGEYILTSVYFAPCHTSYPCAWIYIHRIDTSSSLLKLSPLAR